MKYDFDKVYPRKNTNSIKYDLMSEYGKPKDTIPLWVADMDFPAPPEVLQALKQKSDHGIFGYSNTGAAYFEAVQNWFRNRHNWMVHEEWLIKCPGVVFTLSLAVRALTQKNDAVLIQQPVYYPFASIVEKNERRLVVNQLIFKDGRYSIDLEDFERQITQNNVKLFLLCSPHNPVGRVWTKEELIAMGDICMRHHVTVVADEIHADFVYPGHTHHVFAGLKPEYADNSVTCTAPSKTFNLAGLQISNAFIPNQVLREKMQRELDLCGYFEPNIMGIVACHAAYTYGEEWLNELLVYLQGNMEYTRRFFSSHLPEVKLIPPEGTYLAWLDCTELGTDDDVNNIIVQKAKLWLDAGTMFGQGGSGFQRVNVACPQSILETAYTRFVRAFRQVV